MNLYGTPNKPVVSSHLSPNIVTTQLEVMRIIEFNKQPITEQGSKRLIDTENTFQKLVEQLNTKEIPYLLAEWINEHIEELNTFSGSEKARRKLIKKNQWNILRRVEKELQLVTKNMYRNRWMAIGMAVFGVPLGAAFGILMGNMAFVGIGIPIGMVIGMSIGAAMDKKAKEENRQLDLEINM